MRFVHGKAAISAIKPCQNEGFSITKPFCFLLPRQFRITLLYGWLLLLRRIKVPNTDYALCYKKSSRRPVTPHTPVSLRGAAATRQSWCAKCLLALKLDCHVGNLLAMTVWGVTTSESLESYRITWFKDIGGCSFLRDWFCEIYGLFIFCLRINRLFIFFPLYLQFFFAHHLVENTAQIRGAL